MAQLAMAPGVHDAWQLSEPESHAVCPLCGSEVCDVRFSTNAVSLVECPACIGRGTTFWVTTQAGTRATSLRSGGQIIDAGRARQLVARRVATGNPAYIQQSDLDDLLA